MMWKTLYDVADVSSPQFDFTFPVVIVIYSYGITLLSCCIKKKERSVRDSMKGFASGTAVVLVTGLFYWHALGEFNNIKSLYRSGDYHVVQGVVENFVRMPASRAGYESFTIHGVNFRYSGRDPRTFGFKLAVANWGKISNGKAMRLAYRNIDGDTVILKAEINDDGRAERGWDRE
ncbi:MAG: hypothetical protein ABIR47_00500 [Candidatus Kapaibacterium sp.]